MITIAGSVFDSRSVSYDGSRTGGFAYPEDENNWETKFSFEGQDYSGIEGDSFTLNEFIDVEISDVEAYHRGSTNEVKDYKAEYTFSISPNFLTTTYDSGLIVVTNDYKTIDGGIVVTTTDNIGTTNVERIDKILKEGDTEFVIDNTNILDIKIRPFITIETPQKTYRFDAVDALKVNDLGQTTTIIDKPKSEGISTGGIVIISLVSLLSIGFIIVLIRRLRK
jgi:hypothetical protein